MVDGAITSVIHNQEFVVKEATRVSQSLQNMLNVFNSLTLKVVNAGVLDIDIGEISLHYLPSYLVPIAYAFSLDLGVKFSEFDHFTYFTFYCTVVSEDSKPDEYLIDCSDADPNTATVLTVHSLQIRLQDILRHYSQDLIRVEFKDKTLNMYRLPI